MRDPEIDRRFRHLFDLHDKAIEQLRGANESLIVADHSVEAASQSLSAVAQGLSAAAQALIAVGQAISQSHQEMRRVFKQHDEAIQSDIAASRGAIDLLNYMHNGG